MKNSYLIATALFSGALLMATNSVGQPDEHKAMPATALNGVADTNTVTDMNVQESTQDEAAQLVEHINNARVALAIKDINEAKGQINQSKELVSALKSASPEKTTLDRVGTSRLTYDYDTQDKYYYFPTGPVEIKQLKSGPFWAEDKGLAVTDAEIVYLRVDLNGDKAEQYLGEATKEIEENDLKGADSALAKLTDAIVKVEEKADLPLNKARDNIALAYHFVAANNFNGARYALNHADNALDILSHDKDYTSQAVAIKTMRDEVKSLQDTIRKNDPTVMQQAGDKMKRWWGDLKSWAKS